MSDEDTGGGSPELQFDRVVTESAPDAKPREPTVVCTACHATIPTEYFHVNGNVFCGRCRRTVEAFAETPRGVVPLATAGVFGLAAGVAGAAIYYAVIAIAHLEIGIVAILIGYMVGYAVRKAARARGGLRFQVLAVALTYLSVAFAYTPLVFEQARAGRNAENEQASSITDGRPDVTTSGVRQQPSGARSLVGWVLLAGFIAALPVMMIVGSFPSGLISAFIIFIGMRQAWRMTGAPSLEILGPYRVGAEAAPTPA
jgi:hypothetical protein